MSNYEYYPQAIEGFVDFTQSMAETLNDWLMVLIGDEAVWENHIGIDKIPDGYLRQDLNDGRLAKLWELRESANSLLLIEADRKVKLWAETVSEVNETCKQQRKQIGILEQQASNLHDRTLELSGGCIKLRNDALDRFRAIKILVSASIRDCNIGLNHRVRDERLKHLSDVIDAQISECGSFTLRTYDDDF
jgi:hypothetical protein